MKLKELIDKVSITELNRYINTFANSSSNNNYYFYKNRKDYLKVFENLKRRAIFPIEEKEIMIIYCFNTRKFPEMLSSQDYALMLSLPDYEYYDMVKLYRKSDIESICDDKKDTPWNSNPPILSYNCSYVMWNSWLNYEINENIVDIKQFPEYVILQCLFEMTYFGFSEEEIIKRK